MIILSPDTHDPIFKISEIGILLLLFLIGLDLDFGRFKKLMFPASFVAVGGVVLPFVFGYFVSIYFGFSSLIALFVSVSLVATSVGISASVLHESGRLESDLGVLIVDSAVLDDIIGII